MEANKYIEHTLLKPEATKEQIRILCEEAKSQEFLAVCVNPTWVSYCKDLLADSKVLVCTVIGFPLGASLSTAKAAEAQAAVAAGADELDMVINIGYLKSGLYQEVVEDIKTVLKACQGRPLKVIIETCLLSEEEKVLATQAVVEAKAAFVKTSTGFSSGGAKVEDVALMKTIVKDKVGIKAAGGVADINELYAMVTAGASRIGTSRGLSLMKMATQEKEGGDSSY